MVLRVLLPLLPLLLPPASGHASDMMVAAYLPEWRYEGAHWKDICATVTHLIFFSLEVTREGELAALDRLPRGELLHEARAAADASRTKLLMCVGGNGRSDGFSSTVRSDKKRARFVSALVALCEKSNFDGIDLNWEYPGFQFGRGYLSQAEVDKDYAGLHKLIAELHAALAASGKVVTLAYYPDGRQEPLLAKAAPYVDAMHMMSYDQPGRHSTEEFAMGGARLLPANKLTVGLPFYGRHVQSGDWKSYEDIVQWGVEGPHVDEVRGYYFNGQDLIARKTEQARKLGLRGVMIWEVGQDCRMHPVTHGTKTHPTTCPEGEKSSLLTAIRRGMATLDNDRDEL
ncbi:hypothetical protein AB1Y20_004572 [Prymnesium parvum]|uniref:GH18 domain-containing protein n=1 Tax=Prymnesium parvum TaxID=97485 RepID=A0AB34IX51_PRYPA